MFNKIFFFVKVEGESCWPSLVSGRRYFATALLPSKVGSFVVFKNPKNPDQVLVKKVLTISDEGIFEVGGTVSWSSEYQIPKSLVLGTLISSAKISF